MTVSEAEQVKGVSVMSVRDWIDEKFGAGTFLAFAHSRDLEWPQRILPGDWYPARVLVHTLRRAAERMGDTTLEQITALIAVDNARRDLTTIHRAFLWVASPRMFLRAAPTVWANYANFGEIGEAQNEPGHYCVTISGVPEDLFEWLCGAWLGFLPPALELAGASKPQAQILGRRASQGASTWELDYEVRYE